MVDYLCIDCHWSKDVLGDHCECEFYGSIKMKEIEVGQSALEVCQNWDYWKEWEYEDELETQVQDRMADSKAEPSDRN